MDVIALEHVYKTYRIGDSEVHALDDVTVTIHPGDFTAIVGPSGSGKSTLMHIMGFMDQPTSGSIVFEGRDASRLTAGERAQLRSSRIGFVFQSFNLLPRLSVLDNVLLPLFYGKLPHRNPKARARDLLERVGLSDRSRHLPKELSGGQRQRVAIARALVNDPGLILADEPTGNLDSTNAARILELFRELHSEGRTIALVTHDSQVAAVARRRIEVHDGRVADVQPAAAECS